MAQTKRVIRSLLASAGINPLRRFGQNFLIDGNLMGKLIASAEVTRADVVLEVGPGTGALTEALLDRAGHVVAVEIDRGLHALCQRLLADHDHLTLIHSDVLERKSKVAEPVLAALRETRDRLRGRIMLVANLPYDVATPLLMSLLLGDLFVSPMCFTVQAEVADRLMGRPGSKAYGPISVFTQLFGRIKAIADAPPEAFWPAPKVRSRMCRVDRLAEPPMSREAGSRLVDLVHACFQHRRKTMQWNLRHYLNKDAVVRVEQDGRWDLGHRPEQIDPVSWAEMIELIVE